MKPYASLVFILGLLALSGGTAGADCPGGADNPFGGLHEHGSLGEIATRYHRYAYSDYQAYLNAHPAVRDAAEIGHWDREQQALFRASLEALERDGALPPPPPRFNYPARNSAEQAALDQYRMKLHVRSVAFSLYLELHHMTPWRLHDYRRPELDALLSFRAQFHGHIDNSFDLLMERPDEAYRAQSAHNFQGATQRDSILAMTSWVTHNVDHVATNPDGSNAVPFPQSVPDFLKGGNFGECHITSDFLCTVSVTMNIPCTTSYYGSDVQQGGTSHMHNHAYADFPSESMIITHGDDPYSSKRTFAPLFLNGSQRTEFLQDLATAPDRAEAMMDRVDIVRVLESPDSRWLASDMLKGSRAYVEITDADLERLRGEGVAPEMIDALTRKRAEPGLIVFPHP